MPDTLRIVASVVDVSLDGPDDLHRGLGLAFGVIAEHVDGYGAATGTVAILARRSGL